MAEAFLTIARNIFQQKYDELRRLRDELRSQNWSDLSRAQDQKIKEYQKLLAELGKNFRRSEKILQEMSRRLAISRSGRQSKIRKTGPKTGK